MVKIQEGVLLKNYSTFKIGGPAKYFVEIKNLEELKEVINLARKKQEKFMILGGGSNILFDDRGFDGLVIRLINDELRMVDEKTISCGAGARLSSLVRFVAKNNLAGLEWAAGIPGTVGGAIRGNAGAFGSEMKDITKKVVYFDLNNFEKEACNSDECRFDYRQSVFKEFDHKVILEALFELNNEEENLDIDEKISAIIKQRQESQPFLAESGSAGCIFKNPVVSEKIVKMFEEEKGVKCNGSKVPAGWLIDMCGFKGYRVDGAQVNDKQANFILNVNNATSNSVIILISLIKQKVRGNFGVQLEEEVEIIGY